MVPFDQYLSSVQLLDDWQSPTIDAEVAEMKHLVLWLHGRIPQSNHVPVHLFCRSPGAQRAVGQLAMAEVCIADDVDVGVHFIHAPFKRFNFREA